MSDIAATASAAPPVDVSASLPARLAKGFVGRLVIIVPYLWLLFFFLVPFVIVFKISLSQSAISMPPTRQCSISAAAGLASSAS